MAADGAGIRFGQYVLLRRIARGGMAEVFLAQQHGLEGFDRCVAVKRILPHLSDAPDFIKMFLGEARLAAQLSHPNIVHIYDFGKVDDDFFIAMEYVDGVSVITADTTSELIAQARGEAPRAAELRVSPTALAAAQIPAHYAAKPHGHHAAHPGAGTTILEVRTRPDGATVRVAGRRRVAPAQFALPAGRYAIDAEADGWMPERRSVDLVEGVRLIQDIVFTTRLRGTRRAKTGKLTVRTTPPCEVYLGGSRLTETPFTEMEFEPATYTLVFKHPRYATVTRRVTIAAGKTTRLSFKLR